MTTVPFSTLLTLGWVFVGGVPRVHAYGTAVPVVRGVLPSSSSSSRRDFVYSSSLVAASLFPVLVSPSPVSALTPTEASHAYNTYASTYDELDGGSAAEVWGISQARAAMVAQASGKVLEIGGGTGLNLAYYNVSQIESLTLLDVSQGMLEQAQNRYSSHDDQERWKAKAGGRTSPPTVRFVQGDATSELVPRFGPASFDTVVDSFSLCVMGTLGAQQCLDQLQRVVTPGTGRLLLLENARASNPLVGAYQDATASAAAQAGGKGCVYNQNVRAMIEATPGLIIVKEISYAGGLFRAFECRVEGTVL